MESEIDIKSFLEEHGYPVRDSGNEWLSKCLYRGGDGWHLSINKKSLKWFDFVRAEGGEINSLIKLITGKEGLENQEQQYSFSNTDWVDELTLPKTFDKTILDSLIKDHSYWENRGISRMICESLGGGIVNEAIMPKFKDRYLIPIWDSRNNLSGVTGRYIGHSNSKWIPKYKHGNPKSTFVWPRDPQSIQNRTVILTESPACCMSFLTLGMNNSLCLFGVSCSQAIINYLISNSVSKIIIATNSDVKHSVGQEAAEKIKNKLEYFFDDVEIRLPLKKDINDWLCSGEQNEIVDFYSKKRI